MLLIEIGFAILGFIVGMAGISQNLYILFYGKPLTLELSQYNLINSSDILKGYRKTLIVWITIFLMATLCLYIFGGLYEKIGYSVGLFMVLCNGIHGCTRSQVHLKSFLVARNICLKQDIDDTAKELILHNSSFAKNVLLNNDRLI